VDVRKEIDQRWNDLPVPARLVTEAPIPLNEEQRKILDALQQPNVRYVIVQRPPGTGKSHTITAIAFECILKGRTLLVLSDKNEALDVVQGKLTQAMNQVRPNQSFQNPILRLGLTGGTYAKLLAHSSVDSIKDQHYAASSRRAEIETGINNARAALNQNIASTIGQLSGINLADIESLHQFEELIRKRAPGIVDALE
jgi:AAA domain-containing protein